MKPQKRLLIKFALIIVISVLIGIFLELGLSGYKYLKAGNLKGKNTITSEHIKLNGIDEEKGSYIVSQDGGSIEVDLKNEYVNKFQFSYTSLENAKCEVRVYTKNLYGDSEIINIKDNFSVGLPRSVINISNIVSKIEIKIPKMNSELAVSKFVIDNSLKFNPLRSAFIMVIVFIAQFLLLFKKENAIRIEIATFVCVFAIGLLMIVVRPSYFSSWDEQIHFLNIYGWGVLEKGDNIPESVNYLYDNVQKLNTRSIEERVDLIRILNQKDKQISNVVNEQSFQIANVGYVFQAAAWKMGTFLQMPFYIIWLFGELINLLLYAICMSIAVYIIPVGKRIFSLIILFPTAIFQASSYTYDILVLAFISLALCILIRSIMMENETFKSYKQVLFLVLLCIGCLPKAVYAPFILLGLFVPNNKFPCNKNAYIFKGIIVGCFFVLMSTFVLPTLINPSETADIRGGNTSISGQLRYIFGRPLAYTLVLLGNIKNTFAQYFFGTGITGHFAYLGENKNPTLFAVFLAVVTITDTYALQGSRKTLTRKYKWVLGIGIFIVISLIWTALYMSFTAVGALKIAGVQPRYYLPFFILIPLIFQSDKIINNFNLAKYQLVVMSTSCVLLLELIYRLIVESHCL